MTNPITYRVALLRADGTDVVLGESLGDEEAGELYWKAAGEYPTGEVRIESSPGDGVPHRRLDPESMHQLFERVRLAIKNRR